MLGQNMDFSCSRLYKPTPGTFEGALAVWPADEVSAGDWCFGRSWAEAAMVKLHAITPKTGTTHSRRWEHAKLDCLTGSVRLMLIPWRIGIARDYPIAS